MDDIWWKAAKNIRKREECLSAIRTRPETKPAAIAATTTTPTYANPATSSALMEEDMNTVGKKLTHNSLAWSKIGRKLDLDHSLRAYETQLRNCEPH
jgi:hypothetical protein